MKKCKVHEMRRPSLIGIVTLLCVAAGIPVTPQETPIFPSEEQVVLLDLVARDKKGLVGDLTPGEVQVFEDGQACEIVSFRLVRSPLRGSSAAETAQPEPPLPGEATPTATPSRPNLVVLLFDRLPVQNAAAARQGALDLLAQRFPADTWFAIYKVDRSTRRLQTFTSDPRELTSAVEAATSGDHAARAFGDEPPSTPAPSIPGAPGGDLAGQPDVPGTPASSQPLTGIARLDAGVVGEVRDLTERIEASDSLHGISALARGLSEVRGRKTILFFATDREIPLSAASTYDLTISAANRANVTVHTVDTRGLVSARPGDRGVIGSGLSRMSASAPTQPQPEWGMAGTEWDNYTGYLRKMEPLQNPTQGSFLEHVAHDTGGLLIENTNDLGAGLARVVEELGDYYEIAYHPANPEPDGRFRRISVKVSRSGVKVRTRSGYFATPRSSPGVEAVEIPLIAALGASPPPRDFEHESGVLHFGARGKDRESLLMARVPMSEVRLTADEAGGVFRGRVSLLGMVRDEAGRGVARLSNDWPIEEPLERLDAVRGTAALFRQAFALPAGRYTLETAVRDGETGALSVETSTFEIPEAPPGHLAVGSLSIVRRVSAAEGGASDPLTVAGVAIQPALGVPEIPARTPEVPLFLPIFPTLATEPTELRLEVLRDGQPVADVNPAVPAPEPNGEIAWIGGLPAAALPPGRYEIVATVLQGVESAEARTTFAISAAVGATAVAAVPPVPEDLVPILDRAARYVLDYERSFDDIAAEESYTQWSRGLSRQNLREPERAEAAEITPTCSVAGCRRQTKADVVFVRLAGSVPWGTLRDVFEVDGHEVHEEKGRLVELLSTSSPAGASQRAEAILNESARYNIGPAIRTINFPTLSLAFLLPKNQARFAWTRGGTRQFGSVETVEVDFEEIARPTLVDRGGQGDLPAEGRFWIDPERGTVVRSETRFRVEPRRARATVSTQYRAEPRLAMWVPAEMREDYRDLDGTPDPYFRAPSEAIARYSNFRRFTVAIEDEEVSLPPR